MRVIILLIGLMIFCPHSIANERQFTQPGSEKMLELEKEIAYFYGAKEPELIAHHYIQAIQMLEQGTKKTNKKALEKKMLPMLEEAYKEVQEQTSLEFDAHKAAVYEFNLILAQAEQKPFEDIYHIMVNLYEEVYKSNEPAIKKAAMLRTFLYKYKIQFLIDNEFLDEDIDLLKNIANRSEEELDGLV